ncbi:MAG: SMP-30/gluconolactonase/LRE family protein [Reyranella sp.]|nr:SMP-30/gluconolactonase/LRE family protein [Reyranella sp.]
MDQVATGYGLIEGPVWDPARGLYFSDVLNGGVFLLDRVGKISLAVPKRRGIGGMSLHEAGGLVVGGRDIACVSLKDGAAKTLLSLDAIPGATGFNDLTTDRAGRVYVGSLAYRVFSGEAPRPGHLHVIDLDGTMRTLSDGILLTNGLGFSPDGKLLYHSDARAPLVRVYDVKEDGSVGPWRKFASLGDDRVPDGLKVASDGSVWVADAHGGPLGGRVAVFNSDGTHRHDIAVPLPMVTSLCFAGDDLRDLYIVTGSRGGPHDNCGSIFRIRVDVAGLALPPARIHLAR